jgi:hypothetical protein
MVRPALRSVGRNANDGKCLRVLGEGMFRKLVLSVSMITLIATQAQAAILQLQGHAFVDNGAGFRPATNYMQLNPGDRIHAEEGCALIVYHNGYQSKVCNGQMAVVVSDVPQPATTGSLKDITTSVAQDSFNTYYLIGGGLLAGVGIGTAIALASGNDKPHSP